MKHTAPATNRPRLQSDALKALTNHDWAAATEHLAMALIENPAWADGWLNLGLARLHLHQPQAAISALQRDIGLDPNGPRARCSLTEAWLQAVDLKAAVAAGREECRRLSDFPRGPSPEGGPLRGPGTKTRSPVLSEPEQGPGDTIQFIRFIPELCRRGYPLWLGCPKPLKMRLKGYAWLKGQLANAAEAAGDSCRLPLMRMPSKQGVTNLVEFSDRYQEAPQPRDDSPSEAARRRYGCRRVGFVLRGSRQHKNDHRRSLPIWGLTTKQRQLGELAGEGRVTGDLNLLPTHLETIAHTSIPTRVDQVVRQPTIDDAGSKFEDFLKTARAIKATKANSYHLDYLQSADQNVRRHLYPTHLTPPSVWIPNSAEPLSVGARLNLKHETRMGSSLGTLGGLVAALRGRDLDKTSLEDSL